MTTENEKGPEQMRLDLDVQGLMLGAGLTAEKVKAEICPECPFKTSICEWRMKLWLDDPDLAFVCKGMRAWVTKSN